MPKEPDQLIYIDELCLILNRRANTIRKWEREGKLPKTLLPKRGERNRRYWTHKQVYGQRGIIAWMARNDMRPGRLLTAPENEAEHVANLRKPKYINGDTIRGVRQMIEHGRSERYILNRVLPKTRYVSEESLSRALRTIAKREGWTYPPPAKSKKR